MTDGAHLFRRKFLTHCSVVGACGAMALPSTAKEQLKLSPGNAPHFKDFELLIGTRFEAENEKASSGRFEMELSEVIPGKHAPPAGFPHSFSLVFRVPGQKRFPQDVYTVKHHLLDSFEQLLVPVDLPEKSNNLQAVFC